MMLRSRSVLAAGLALSALSVLLLGGYLMRPADVMRARVSYGAPMAMPTGAPGEAGATAALVQASARSAGSASATAPGLSSVFASLKLIRTAQISIEVAHYEPAAQEITRVAESLGGYLAEAQAARGQQDRRSGTLTIRVPAERFGEALAALKGLGSVKSEQVSTQDVTKAYTDLQTRLKVKRDTADRLRELLRTRTADLPDVLNAERELARVTEEIEQMEGERRFYDQQVAFSTIALTVFEPEALVEPGVFAPIGRALRDSTAVLAQSLAGLLYLIVALTPWLILAYGVWRAIKAVRGRRKTADAQVQA
jgi:hypothetical protein